MPALKKKEKEQKIVVVLFFVDPIVRFLRKFKLAHGDFSTVFSK